LEQKVSVKQTLKEKLTASLEQAMLEVIDQSHKHRGHVGSRPEGETHFHVNRNAKEVEGESRVARQRLVYDCLKEDLEGPVHALSLKLGTE